MHEHHVARDSPGAFAFRFVFPGLADLFEETLVSICGGLCVSLGEDLTVDLLDAKEGGFFFALARGPGRKTLVWVHEGFGTVEGIEGFDQSFDASGLCGERGAPRCESHSVGQAACEVKGFEFAGVPK